VVRFTVQTRLKGNKPRIWRADKNSGANVKVNQVRVIFDRLGKYYIVDVMAPMAATAGREGMQLILERLNQ
jgi:hypothetical protein